MKILYGVQGTGNGHITRARAMARAFEAAGIEVDWVFSGRSRSRYFDMGTFGNFRSFRGLTFAATRGKVLYTRTVLQNNLLQLYRDIKTLDVGPYDLVLNDFEPVSAWAAKRAGKKVIGISHQSAFHYAVPKRGNNPMVSWFMRNFAPTSQPIGVHWHHFDQPILPPLIEPPRHPIERVAGSILVYLPFTGLDDILPQLRSFRKCRFTIYHAVAQASSHDNIHIHPLARDGFQRDLHRCEGVICNAGFGLASEALQLGKKLLVQPVKGQMEQLSNALALSELGYGTAADKLTPQVIADWLASPARAPLPYPDVAQALVKWLMAGAEDFDGLKDALWRQVPEPTQATAPPGLTRLGTH